MKLSKDEKVLLRVDNEDIDSNGGFTFPDSVTSIGYAAFEECTDLKKLLIPAQITTIGDWAFWNCTNLKTVVLPENLTKIGQCTFHSCTSLEGLVIPKHVTVIAEGAFYRCFNFKTIILPESINEIGRSAFEECINLEALFISKNITLIGREAFFKCNKLETIFTEGEDNYIDGVKKFLPYELAIKVTPATFSEEIFSKLNNNQAFKPTQATSPILFFNKNKNLAQINNKLTQDVANSLDNRPDSTIFS
ncbi:leucine-rich repeat domain-containing protein [Legionella gresilensis]|uniref:leucine-rich repeat domain-containing protein n=1 Tax=Legionella gresilensis TaxID=91823 RepID=UPI001041BD00|nr:leucine-rich repeat domain-containing protein [Legionella gresilensis]